MNLRVILAATLAAAVTSLPAAGQAVRSGDDAVLKATLPNGLRVVIVPTALAPAVSTDLTYLVGSRDDPAEFPGMAHAQEHMMFRGTKNLSTAQLGTIATALGGRFNAETSDTLTQFEFTVPAPDLDAVLRIESDRMRDVLDEQSQWEDERGAIEQEVLRDESTPGSDFFRDAKAYAFAGTPYAREGVGTIASFNRLTGPELKRFYDRWYAPNNAVLVIAGDVDPGGALAQIRSYFDSIPKRPISPHPPARPQPLERKVLRRPTTLTYPLAAVAFRFPGVKSPDFLASYLLQQVLESPRSRLQSLVDSGAALDAEWVSMPYVPEGQLGMATAALAPGANPSDMTKRLENILREYATGGVPSELFETTKRQSILAQELGRNSVSSLASDWATTIALDEEPSIAREQQLLARVSLADVDRAAKRYLEPNRAFIAALTPSAKAYQTGPPAAPQNGPEKPLDVRGAATTLPSWGNSLLERITVPSAAGSQPTRMRLPNGITLIVRPAGISDSVLIFGSVRTNAALQEPAGKEGVASVLGAVFAYGTQNRDRQAFQRAQDDADTQLGAGARFGAQTRSTSFERAVSLLAEAELRPRFTPQTFEAARRHALEEFETSRNGTGTIAELQLQSRLLPPGDPALRQPTRETILGLNLEDVRSYYAKTFRPDLTTIVVVGNVTAERARTAIERAFGSWRTNGQPPSLDLPKVPLNPPGDVHVTVPQNQAAVTLTQLVTLERSSPQYPAMELANAVFGGGSLGPEQSRLFRDIRQNAGLVYSVSSRFAAGKTRSEFSVDFASSPENVDRISRLIDEEITRMQKETVGNFELSLAKAATARRTTVDAASLSAIGQSLLDAAQSGVPLNQDELDAQAIVATSSQAVREAFASYVRPSGFVKVVVGP